MFIPKRATNGRSDSQTDYLSPLMRAKGFANQGEPVNFCPFGCTDEDLDEHGYCLHLIGFTNDGKKIESLKMVNRVFVKPNGRKTTLQVLTNQVGYTVKKLGGGRIKKVFKYEQVLPGDQLVRISTSARVYRNVPKPVEEAFEDASDDADLIEDGEVASIEEEYTEDELETLTAPK